MQKYKILEQLGVCGWNRTASALFLQLSFLALLVQNTNADSAFFDQDGSGAVSTTQFTCFTGAKYKC